MKKTLGYKVNIFLFLLPALFLFVAVLIAPIVMSAYYSFMNWNGLKDPMILWLTRGPMVDVVGEDGKVDERTEARIVVSGERDGFVDAFVGRGSENKVNTILPLNDLDDMEKINILNILVLVEHF